MFPLLPWVLREPRNIPSASVLVSAKQGEGHRAGAPRRAEGDTEALGGGTCNAVVVQAAEVGRSLGRKLSRLWTFVDLFVYLRGAREIGHRAEVLFMRTPRVPVLLPA